jgi:bifunctional non-homologous end joining protein LigD
MQRLTRRPDSSPWCKWEFWRSIPGARQDRLERPDRLIFDLDPIPRPLKQIKEAAETLRDRMSGLGFSAFVKTTGGKGLHVVVPITPKQDWEAVKLFAKKVAEDLVREAPQRYTATMTKSKRKGKIYIDYLRNTRTATAVCAFSTRARANAPVSVPVHWRELATDVRGEYFTIRNVPQRLARQRTDPWAGCEKATTITDKLIKLS